MTKPKLLPSLCKQMSIVFDITPEVLSGALRRDIERQEDFIHFSERWEKTPKLL